MIKPTARKAVKSIKSRKKKQKPAKAYKISAPSHSSNGLSSAQQIADEQPLTNFFYSDDKFVNAFEDDDIIQRIQIAYPEFDRRHSDDSTMKRMIITVLEDVEFMTDLLEQYNMTILDFFKFLYRQESSLFKTVFIQRIQRAITNKPYATIKTGDYQFRYIKALSADVTRRYC